MGRLRVQQCVLNRTTRQYGTHPTSDLLGVNYFHPVPGDTEFPYRLGPLELFARILSEDRVGGKVLITVALLNENHSVRQVVYRKRVSLPTVEIAGPIVVATSFKLMNVVVPAEGLYAVRMVRRVRRRWEEKASWRLLATDFLWIERPS